MTQVTANDFEDVAQSQLLQTPKQDLGTHSWHQLSAYAAAVARGLRRWAQGRSDQTLPPSYVLNRQFRHDTLRIEVRRLL